MDASHLPEKSRAMPRKQISDEDRKLTTRLRAQRFRKRLVNLGDQVEAWRQIKEELQIERDRDVARILIDSYRSVHCLPSAASVPASSNGREQISPDVSRTPSADDGSHSSDDEDRRPALQWPYPVMMIGYKQRVTAEQQPDLHQEQLLHGAGHKHPLPVNLTYVEMPEKRHRGDKEDGASQDLDLKAEGSGHRSGHSIDSGDLLVAADVKIEVDVADNLYCPAQGEATLASHSEPPGPQIYSEHAATGEDTDNTTAVERRSPVRIKLEPDVKFEPVSG